MTGPRVLFFFTARPLKLFKIYIPTQAYDYLPIACIYPYPMGTDPRAVLGRRALEVVVSFCFVGTGAKLQMSINQHQTLRDASSPHLQTVPEPVDDDDAMMESSQVSSRVQLTYLRQWAIHSRTKHKRFPEQIYAIKTRGIQVVRQPQTGLYLPFHSR